MKDIDIYILIRFNTVYSYSILPRTKALNMCEPNSGHLPVPTNFNARFGTDAQQKQARIQQLGDDITELAAHIDAATFRWLELIHEFDECQGWAGDGIKSCAHWLNWKCGLGLNSARERVRVAHAIQQLPHTREAFREGRLSYSKARAITRVASPGNETVLLNIAHHGTAWHVERAANAYRRGKRLEWLEREKHRHDLRELNWMYDDDGCLVMNARFTPEQGAIVRQAVESVMQEMFEERKNVSAETSVHESPSLLKSQPTPHASRRADALARIAEGWMTQAGANAGGDRFVINVHTDLETLRVDGSGAESEIEDGKNVSAETSRRLACDASVVQWLNRLGSTPSGIEPLSVGRKTRTIPPSIRRALQRRDLGCRFPGCTCVRFVDAHHIHHWADGGETRMDNLVLLCRHHHRLVHEGGFRLLKTLSGELQFTLPTGKLMLDVPEKRFRGNVFELLAANRRHGINITPKTPIPNWLGESMDVDLVVHHMQKLE